MEIEYTTSINGETEFILKVLETGWIYNIFWYWRNIRLNCIYSGKEIINKKVYSVFNIYYKFNQISECEHFYFTYMINEITYTTHKIYFEISDYESFP